MSTESPTSITGPSASQVAEAEILRQEVARQHVVSQVLLRRWAVPNRQGSGLALVKFDLEHPDRNHKLKSPRACAYADHFVPVDSATIEALWGGTEKRVPVLFAAIDGGDPFADDDTVQIYRDLVALHFARSYRYRSVYRTSYEKAFESLRANMLGPRRELLRREASRQTGLYLPSGSALESFLDRILAESLPAKGFASGQLFRESIESAFYKVRDLIASWQPELLRAKGAEFIVGDNPAVSIRWHQAQDLSKPVTIHTAVGDAHTVVLPLGPKHLVALGPKRMVAELEKPVVEWFNRIQVSAAYQHVFFKPSKNTLKSVRAASRSWRASDS
ncbi:DUF4238 domain-containing protein [Actinomadura sp. SCN-SB]|uniref:DUF4238 domain-containing protein n=1 Tax=Actinomadura sp. SCN-SB TaxID=3373092 RepID=UPI0037504034